MSGRTWPSRSTSSPASTSARISHGKARVVDLDVVEGTGEVLGAILAGARAQAGDQFAAFEMLVVPAVVPLAERDAVDVDVQLGSLANEAEQMERTIVDRRRCAHRVVIGPARVLIELDVHLAAGVAPVVPEAAVHADGPLAEHTLELGRVDGADPVADAEVGSPEVPRGGTEGHRIVDSVEAEALPDPLRCR